MRRRRKNNEALDLPAALLPAAVTRDPDSWRTARHEWARSRDWGPQMRGHLAFFDETVYWYHTALGRRVPIGCLERYERVLRGQRGDVSE